MRTFVIAAAAIVMGCIGASGSAEAASPAFTVQEMLSACKSQIDAEQIECISYLRGLADAMEAIQSMRSTEKTADVPAVALLAACPGRISGGQLEQVFINWAEAHPTIWQEPRGYALAAIHNAWPCQ